MTDEELDAAIEAAAAELKRLRRLRRDRRYSANARANPGRQARAMTPEVRQRMSDAHKGKKRTEAERVAISAGMRASWRARKGQGNTWAI